MKFIFSALTKLLPFFIIAFWVYDPFEQIWQLLL